MLQADTFLPCYAIFLKIFLQPPLSFQTTAGTLTLTASAASPRVPIPNVCGPSASDAFHLSPPGPAGPRCPRVGLGLGVPQGWPTAGGGQDWSPKGAGGPTLSSVTVAGPILPPNKHQGRCLCLTLHQVAGGSVLGFLQGTQGHAQSVDCSSGDRAALRPGGEAGGVTPGGSGRGALPAELGANQPQPHPPGRQEGRRCSRVGWGQPGYSLDNPVRFSA